MYIDYTETPEADNNKYTSDDHYYKVLHTGNTKYIDTYTATIGDGTSSTFTVEHNLGTENVIIQLRNISTKVDITNTSTSTIIDENTITITTTNALPSNGVTLTILGIK